MAKKDIYYSQHMPMLLADEVGTLSLNHPVLGKIHSGYYLDITICKIYPRLYPMGKLELIRNESKLGFARSGSGFGPPG